MHLCQARTLLSISIVGSLLTCFTFTQSNIAAYSHGSTAAIPPATLVKDIDTAPGRDIDPEPYEFVAVGNTIFFAAEDHTNARELWKTDGTQTGTVLVRDIIPGGYKQSGPYNLTSFNNELFFATSVEYGPTTLWRSDGTANGTIPVLIMPKNTTSLYNMTVLNGHLLFFANPGVYSSPQSLDLYTSDGTAAGTIRIKQVAVDINTITVANNQLFFVAQESATGSELWKSDGTTEGTMLVKDIRPGPGSAFKSPYSINSKVFTTVGNKIFFVANDGVTGDELWQSDGTYNGTSLLKDISPGSGYPAPSDLTILGKTLFFVVQGTLWKTDGTSAGTVQVRQNDGNAVVGASNLITISGQIFFWQTRYNLVLYNTSLWRSDGTNAGTVEIKSFDPNDSSNPSPTISSSYSQQALGNKLLFISNSDIWISDGSEAGTYFVKEMYPRSNTNASGQFIAFRGILLFLAGRDQGDQDFWRSDGTEAGTVRLTVIPSEILLSYPIGFIIVGDRVLLATHGLYVSDGTPAGTSELKHIDSDGDSSFDLWQYQNSGDRARAAETIPFKNTLFFAASSADGSANGLWKSDGTEAGTTLVKAFQGDYSDKSLPFDLTVVNDTLFFATSTDGMGYLWKSDGSEQGTVIVKQYDAQYLRSIIDNLTNVNGTLFFTAFAPTMGKELWKSDGTTDGTVIVKDITPGYDSSDLEQLTSVGNTLFFLKEYGSSSGLWKSDGTEVGTVLVKPSSEDGISYSSPYSLTAIDHTLFFGAADAVHGFELWKSDGTDAGTVLVKDINPGSADSSPYYLSVFNGALYFVADDGTHGYELWKSDGSESGTALVRDINPGANVGSQPLNIHSAGNIMFLLADDGTHGTELWRSDGTEAGTVMLKDLVPGVQQWELPFFEATPLPDGKRALLDVYTPDSGIELWISDGTSQGTLQVQDIAPGPASADPSNINIIGDRAFFVADDTVHGRELWSLHLADLPTPSAPTPDIPTPNVPAARKSIFLPSITK